MISKNWHVACAAIFLASIAACSNGHSVQLAWRCTAQKDVMALRIGQAAGVYESISFDGSGLAVHMKGRRPFAPNYDSTTISMIDDSSIDIFLRSSGQHIEVRNVEKSCMDWLKTNNRLQERGL